ncbi:PREDICTED: uncharacterized protein LOC104601191 isoform X1 [Nelumbo nucifera]|uniref:IRK-interacting protein-like n=2 Tax=Nelumbo nucifera TaxID=4432 RepID=A0A822YA20_NELNU|nr:PREDICTED: uncharacterized protein LOC104601191 isoform X1 [Nelumbo nucifera]DAD28401.1 TPA_asm: hypothetical protein HUJ06_029869 [Nelumbo nucifera]
MFPRMCVNLDMHILQPTKSTQKKTERKNTEKKTKDEQILQSIALSRKSMECQTRLPLRSDDKLRTEGIKAKKKSEPAAKASNFSDLIHRAASSCFHRPPNRGRKAGPGLEDRIVYKEGEVETGSEVYTDEDESEAGLRVWEENTELLVSLERMKEMEVLMGEVFETVAALRNAYKSLEEAQCPWDPKKLKMADVVVVAELRRLIRLKEEFQKRLSRAGKGGLLGQVSLQEAIAPYESAMWELKKQVETREREVDNLKEKRRNGGKKGRFHSLQSKRKVSCIHSQVGVAPSVELFEATMRQVKDNYQSFTALLLSLMQSAHWDIAAAVRSIEAATSPNTTSIVKAHHASYALESYVCRKMFYGFDHETFYMDNNVPSFLHPDQFRRDCLAQFQDMKATDPVELLSIFPTCGFGKFCSMKFLSLIHPKMEESLFGHFEQRRVISTGNHPRSEFYEEFLAMAKAVWLLHLLAFALDPAPCHFQATRGAKFHPLYMESVIEFSGRREPRDWIVGFPVTPGFKLGDSSIIKAEVYLVPRT